MCIRGQGVAPAFRVPVPALWPLCVFVPVPWPCDPHTASTGVNEANNMKRQIVRINMSQCNDSSVAVASALCRLMELLNPSVIFVTLPPQTLPGEQDFHVRAVQALPGTAYRAAMRNAAIVEIERDHMVYIRHSIPQTDEDAEAGMAALVYEAPRVEIVYPLGTE